VKDREIPVSIREIKLDRRDLPVGVPLPRRGCLTTRTTEPARHGARLHAEMYGYLSCARGDTLRRGPKGGRAFGAQASGWDPAERIEATEQSAAYREAS
jgi:hypothetical protein